MQQNHCQDSATYSDGSKTQAHAPTVRALKTARCEGACRAPGGGGNPFINSLPFNAILQQDIESRFARNRRARQIHSQTFVCERQRDDVWHHAHPQASPLPTPKAVSAVGARSSTQPSAAKSPRASPRAANPVPRWPVSTASANRPSHVSSPSTAPAWLSVQFCTNRPVTPHRLSGRTLSNSWRFEQRVPSIHRSFWSYAYRQAFISCLWPSSVPIQSTKVNFSLPRKFRLRLRNPAVLRSRASMRCCTSFSSRQTDFVHRVGHERPGKSRFSQAGKSVAFFVTNLNRFWLPPLCLRDSN
jgi:hypothetical protein